MLVIGTYNPRDVAAYYSIDQLPALQITVIL